MNGYNWDKESEIAAASVCVSYKTTKIHLAAHCIKSDVFILTRVLAARGDIYLRLTSAPQFNTSLKWITHVTLHK